MDAKSSVVRKRSARAAAPRGCGRPFLADEEEGGSYVARYMATTRGLFEVSEAVSEVGGFSVTPAASGLT